MIITCKSTIVFVLLFILSTTLINAQQLAFPTAEGFGRYTSGGRGGTVIAVTNLNDYGPGSLRSAIEAKGARTIIFKLSGTIILESPLIIENDSLTIAGQTAPGDGICIRNFPTIIDADNVIIRYIRFRLGDEKQLSEDALMAIGQKNIIIDHCSMSWGIDEVGSFYDNENSTVQWCIISEGLNHSFHPKGDHGYGAIWGGKGASFHHNILANNISRNPRFNGSRTHKEPEKELVDFRNNVIYNWGTNSAYGGESGKQNIVANYYKAGPASHHKNRIIEPSYPFGTWYINDNYVFGYPEISENNWNGGVQGKYEKTIKSDTIFTYARVLTQPAEEAYEIVLKNAGAILPKRDLVDMRIVNEIKSGNNHFSGTFGPGIIDSQADVGGWPDLKSTEPPKDSDNDGMPDLWELKNDLDINANDSNLDKNQDGYTNLENYLNSFYKKERE